MLKVDMFWDIGSSRHKTAKRVNELEQEILE